MKILQLCCFTNHWSDYHQVESHDIKNGKDIFDLPDDYGKNFDFIISAPPCRQFTVANSRNWEEYPKQYIEIARKCFTISILSGKPWVLENVIGRIAKLLPELKPYRVGTWKDTKTTKKHLIFSNCLIMLNIVDQTDSFPVNLMSSKREHREAWNPSFIRSIAQNIEQSDETGRAGL